MNIETVNSTIADQNNNFVAYSSAFWLNQKVRVLSASVKIEYTEAALEDALLFHLSSFNSIHLEQDIEGNEYIRPYWQYQEQAEVNLYRCNVHDQPPEFVIFENDLPAWLINELADELDKKTRHRIITNAVRRLYESMDSEYYHVNGIASKVRWRFVS
jgi:hypothetical protein